MTIDWKVGSTVVNIITGKINGGKTTRLIAAYEKSGVGEGFALIKKMEGTIVHSYNARQLSSGEERLLILRDCWLTDDFDERCRIGPYYFSDSVLNWIEDEIRKAVDMGITPIFLDEIGKLEVMGKGYDAVLRVLLKSEIDIYVTIRENLVEMVLHHYQISTYNIMTSD